MVCNRADYEVSKILINRHSTSNYVKLLGYT